jgi:hypothetical protein
MNGIAAFGDEWWPARASFLAVHNRAVRRHLEREGAMASTIMTIGLWAGVISLLCYLAMRPTPNRGPGRPSSGDSFGSVGGPYAGDSWNISSGSGADSSGFHNSGASFEAVAVMGAAGAEAINAANPKKSSGF